MGLHSTYSATLIASQHAMFPTQKISRADLSHVGTLRRRRSRQLRNACRSRPSRTTIALNMGPTCARSVLTESATSVYCSYAQRQVRDFLHQYTVRMIRKTAKPWEGVMRRLVADRWSGAGGILRGATTPRPCMVQVISRMASHDRPAGMQSNRKVRDPSQVSVEVKPWHTEAPADCLSSRTHTLSSSIMAAILPHTARALTLHCNPSKLQDPS